MTKITKIVGVDNRGTFALVHVLTDDQEECVVIVGGEVKVYYSDKYDQPQAHVKWPVEKNNKTVIDK